MDAGHSILAPSSGARNVQCPLSTVLEQRFPETETSEASAEGTGAHWVLAEALGGRTVQQGDTTPNGLIVTDEMIDGATMAAEDVEFILRCYGRLLSDAIVETPLTIPRVHEQCWGTPDVRAVAVGPPLGYPPGVASSVSNSVFELWSFPAIHLFVWDFKFGHEPVEVYENQQLIDYVCGYATELRLPDDQAVVCHLRIVQPRAFHKDGAVREWVVRLSDLRALINRRSNAAHEALSGNARARTGPECKHCRARHACKAAQAEALAAADYVKGFQPLELDPGALGLELAILERAEVMLNARLSGLREQALAVMRRGQRVAFHDIERSPGRIVWRRPLAEVKAVGQAMGFELTKEKLITPKQATELGLDPAIVKSLSGHNPGEAKLVPDNNDKTRRIFGRTY